MNYMGGHTKLSETYFYAAFDKETLEAFYASFDQGFEMRLCK